MFGCKPGQISRQRKLRRCAICAALVGILLTPSLSLAVEYTSARKAGRGLAAMTTRFLEIPGNMVAESRKHGAGAGVPLGFVPIIEPEFPWSYFDDQPAPSRSR
jgi:hypothetical protein